MNPSQPISSYNYYYAAVHEAAYEIKPEQQIIRLALEDYANSLPEYTARKLSDKIVKTNSYIKNLQDAMNQAAKIDQELRQAEVMRNKRLNNNSTIDTTINTTVNEVADFGVNYVAAKQGDSRFNSTMKPGHQRDQKDFSPRGRQRDDSFQNKSWNGGRRDSNYSNSYRRINKYRHPARNPDTTSGSSMQQAEVNKKL